MKKFLTVVTILLFGVLYSQKGNFYTSAGISMTNSDNFTDTTFLSLEFGYFKNNISYGVVVGSTDLNLNSYWYEGKLAYKLNTPHFQPYGLVGVGSYFSNSNIFIEYGVGVSKAFNNIEVYTQLSNWDRVNYLTTGLSYNFN